MTGVGVPQITAVADAVEPWKAPVFLLLLTAVSVSLATRQSYRRWRKRGNGGFHAGRSEESPGEIELYQGRSYKSYRVWVPWARCPKVLLTVTSRVTRCRQTGAGRYRRSRGL